MRTLIIDNYDSFTFNICQLLAEVNGEEPIVVQNDRVSWDELKNIRPDCCVISPGPGRPDEPRDFGICQRVIEDLNIPLLGICLGHQGIGNTYGGRVIHAPEPMHGRMSQVYHSGQDILQGIPQGFSVVRYHSLVLSRPLPDCLEEIGWTADGIVMALRHRSRPMWGVQFHPESISTEHGRRLLENFRDLTVRCGSVSVSSARPQVVAPAASRPGRISSSQWRVFSRELDVYPDAETVFQNVYGNEPFSFWLDSSRVETGLSRFSFMGSGAGENSQVIQYQIQERRLSVLRGGRRYSFANLFDYLKTELDDKACSSPELPFSFNCGPVGYLGYELKAECGGSDVHAADVPDAALIFADRLIAIDHLKRRTYLVCFGRRQDEAGVRQWFQGLEKKLNRLSHSTNVSFVPAAAPISFRLKQPRAEYLDNIRRCLKLIRDGESYEICMTNKLRALTDVEPLEFYRHLRRINPAPYSAFLRFGEVAVACSSPERFLTIDCNREVESKPIKGTVARVASAAADARLGEMLRNDIKSRSENLMIVDLLRNDLGKVCETGSVHVPSLMQVETYATVHQLVSTIRGRLKDGVSAVECFRHAFPGGSMTGAPKVRTMEIIDRLEGEARGIYSGAIGFFGLNGSADLNIVIRTAVFRGNDVSIGVGGAIVALSDPIAEFDETMTKASPLLKAFSSVTRQDHEVKRQVLRHGFA